MPRRLIRKAAGFFRQPLWARCWLLPVWALLGLAKAAILIVPFHRIAPHLGRRMGVAPWVPLLAPAQEARALQIGRVVRLAARYTPWNSNCFPQAVAARVLLGLHGIPYVLNLGLMREPGTGELKAHAWVSAGRICVTGGASFGEFTTVGVFVAPALAASGQA